MRWIARWSVLSLVLAACGGESPSATPSADDAGTDAIVTPDSGTEPGLVETSYGPVRGVCTEGTCAFKGIPYAAPPVGELRWRPPEPAAAWTDPFGAQSYGPECMQVEYPSGQTIGSEDCLTLNVWAPEATPATPLPVLVWLHGGDNIIGSSSAEGGLYDGRHLSEHVPAVVVTINYRLAAFGFLAHPAFEGENPEGASGNYGILDQIFALEWVRDNAARFGGDPERVMLFGQSAGASDTCAILASPLAAGLVSRAMMISLSCYIVPPVTIASTNAAAEQFLGCSGAADMAACLRSQSADKVARVPGASLSEAGQGSDYYTVVDGRVLTQHPEQAMASGAHAHVPIVLGTTRDEYAALVDLLVSPMPTTADEYTSTVHALFGSFYGDQIVALYPLSTYGTPRAALVASLSDYVMHCPTRRAANAAAAGQAEPVWRYVFAHPFTDPPLSEAGAVHGYDVPFYFGNFPWAPPADADVAFSETITPYLSRFVHTGDPNGDGAPAWPAWDSTEPYFSIEPGFGTGSAWRSTECDFWDPISN
jgi:para-nitrobenzyl esterase